MLARSSCGRSGATSVPMATPPLVQVSELPGMLGLGPGRWLLDIGSGVEDQTSEQNGREVGAERGLGGIGHDHLVPETPTGAPLCDRKRGHDQQRQCGEDHADRGCGGVVGVEEIAGGFDDRVGGESEERHGDEAKGALLLGVGEAVELSKGDLGRSAESGYSKVLLNS